MPDMGQPCGSKACLRRRQRGLAQLRRPRGQGLSWPAYQLLEFQSIQSIQTTNESTQHCSTPWPLKTTAPCATWNSPWDPSPWSPGPTAEQEGILRPLLANELSDGTLRYLLLMAALLTPRPPALMVLNEPESSLHPDLLPALARLIVTAAKAGQVWVVSHSSRLVAALEEAGECVSIVLEKQLGQTRVAGHSGFLDGPAWRWPH